MLPASNAISIHAPAKGATLSRQAELTAERISIHAPAKGATRAHWCSTASSTNFNPRSREGSDANTKCAIERHIFQSTLPRRERQYRRYFSVLQYPFQSTLPRRERPFRPPKSWSAKRNFNPRSREGSDSPTACTKAMTNNFNPRSREGSDAGNVAVLGKLGISIHAPAKGATMSMSTRS